MRFIDVPSLLWINLFHFFCMFINISSLLYHIFICDEIAICNFVLGCQKKVLKSR